MIRLIAANLLRRKVRTTLTAVGVAVGVATIVALVSISAGLDRTASGLINLGNAQLGLFQAGVGDLTASTLPASLAQRAAQVPGVSEAAPISVLSGELPQAKSFLVFGVVPGSFVVRRLVMVQGRPAQGAEAMVGDAAARQLHLGIGSSLMLSGNAYRVVAIYHAGVLFEDQGAAIPLSEVQRITHRSGDATTIAVAIGQGQSAAVVAHRLERALPGTVGISEPGQVARADTNSLLIHDAVGVLAVLALIIGAIVVMNTTLMAVVERQREFALLAAVGWPPLQVARLVFGEGLAISVLGAIVGLGLGALAAELIVRLLSVATLVAPHFTAWGLGRALLIGIAIGVLGGLYPAWRVTRVHLAQALS